MKPLTGAAKRAHERKILIDRAREAIKRRDPDSVQRTVFLLVEAVEA